MTIILKIFSWKRSLFLSIITLITLILLNFYGLYTNKFYFFKPQNYIFPIVTIVHFIFLYALWFKIRENEIADIVMRNFEYALYGVLLLYVFKLSENIFVLISYSDFKNHVIPDTFMPVGILTLLLHIFLIGLTILIFKYRKDLVGSYKFDDMNESVGF